MRYICCFIIEQDNELIKKVQMLKSENSNVIRGEIELLNKLSSKYNLPDYYVERDDENPVKGVLYIRPRKQHKLKDLCDLDIPEYERMQYGRFNIY